MHQQPLRGCDNLRQETSESLPGTLGVPPVVSPREMRGWGGGGRPCTNGWEDSEKRHPGQWPWWGVEVSPGPTYWNATGRNPDSWQQVVKENWYQRHGPLKNAGLCHCGRLRVIKGSWKAFKGTWRLLISVSHSIIAVSSDEEGATPKRHREVNSCEDGALSGPCHHYTH